MQERNTDQVEQGRLQIGERILDRIRTEASDPLSYFNSGEGEDVFNSLYLTPRDTAIPEHLVSDDLLLDIHVDIRELFFQVYDGIRAELLDHVGREQSIWIAVDPSVDDRSTAVMFTDETVLLVNGTKAWNFWWPDEGAMAADLGDWYEWAERRLRREIAASTNDGTGTRLRR